MMGFYRGVPQDPDSKRKRLELVAAKMLERNLRTGVGCKMIARAIAARTRNAGNPLQADIAADQNGQECG